MNEEQVPLSDAPAEAPLPPVPAPDTESAAPRVPFDPYDGRRHLPWMDRSLSPSVRAARRMRPELKGFAAIEGREPNGADLDAMVGRISAEMTEIFRREWAADVVDEWLEERDAARRLARLSHESSLPPRSGGSAPEGGEGGCVVDAQDPLRPSGTPPPMTGEEKDGDERKRVGRTRRRARLRSRPPMRIDIIFDDGDTVYIFDLKTGGAALKEPGIDRTLNLQAFQGRKVIVMELNPWRLPRK